MGVDYNAVGGIGVEFNDDLQYKAIELEYFTEEEWDEDPTGCVESLKISYESAGDGSYGGTDYWYFIVDGNNLKEVNNNKESFLNMINSKFNVEYTEEDLKVISELHVW